MSVTINTNNTIIEALPAKIQGLLALKGQFASLRTIRQMKTRKGEAPIFKDSTFTVRLGVNYDNITNVQVQRQEGQLPAENQGLKGRVWIEFPYVMQSLKTGSYLMRCTAVTGNANCIPKTVYRRDGQEIAKEVAQAACQACEFSDGERPEVFDITIDNVVEVNGKPL
jgi:hypothetical protein